ncbi:MAG TPA: hypothetical protein VK465_06205 [Fibrobacteria bacterium]|nr:hypothetical protein [Fibrobacteria bacterium]
MLRDGSVELKRCSGEEPEVNRAWIRRTRLVAEGLPAQPYIHLDIRTPFGESVDESQVEAALAESLGTRKDRYSRCGWHIQFVEDTNLGSNHRVFVDLKDRQADVGPRPGMDAALPLEIAVEALAETLQAREGETSFQLLVGGTSQCFSVLYVNGSPFHLLRIPEGAGDAAAARLVRHRDFPQSQGKGGGFRTFLSPGDPLLACEAVSRLSPEIVDFNLRLPQGEGLPKPLPSLYMHLGLALAAARRDLATHNRVQDEE